jgi:ATP-dependent Lhr-like helicase
VFPDVEEYVVREDAREIGTVTMPPPPGERFALAGRTWEVLEIDLGRRMVFVRRVEGKARTSWLGGAGDIHTRILERMRGVLLEDAEYPYVQAGAQARLAEARKLARNVRLDKNRILHLGGERYALLPWVGSVGYRTLERCLRAPMGEFTRVTDVGGLPPYYLTFRAESQTTEGILKGLKTLCERGISAESLLGEKEVPRVRKYDEFIPAGLLRNAFAVDCLDMGEVREKMSLPD